MDDGITLIKRRPPLQASRACDDALRGQNTKAYVSQEKHRVFIFAVLCEQRFHAAHPASGNSALRLPMLTSVFPDGAAAAAVGLKFGSRRETWNDGEDPVYLSFHNIIPAPESTAPTARQVPQAGVILCVLCCLVVVVVVSERSPTKYFAGLRRPLEQDLQRPGLRVSALGWQTRMARVLTGSPRQLARLSVTVLPMSCTVEALGARETTCRQERRRETKGECLGTRIGKMTPAGCPVIMGKCPGKWHHNGSQSPQQIPSLQIRSERL